MSLSGITPGGPASPPVSPKPPVAPAADEVTTLIQTRGNDGWHLDLKQPPEKSQAENLLKGFYQQLASQPEAMAQLAQLPYGQALVESLEAAAQGQLRPEHVMALQLFLSDTAGIDISYGGSRGVDGMLGPRTLAGLQVFCDKLTGGGEPGQASSPTQYLSSLELSAETRQPAIPSLSLFTDTPSGQMYEQSPYHDESKFVPTFGMTSYHESGSYRSPRDPYAVGAITHPRRGQDLGGKSYGTYQFESGVYADGSQRGNSGGSTLMRFILDKDNPFGSELRDALKRYGVATPQFDAIWSRLARERNKEFGEAQQAFMLKDKASNIQSFFDQADFSDEVRKDPRIVDMVVGTTNHVGGLAASAAAHLAQLQRAQGRKLTADEAGRALAEYKQQHIPSWFQSSPQAWNGLRNRFNDERTQFA